MDKKNWWAIVPKLKSSRGKKLFTKYNPEWK